MNNKIDYYEVYIQKENKAFLVMETDNLEKAIFNSKEYKKQGPVAIMNIVTKKMLIMSEDKKNLFDVSLLHILTSASDLPDEVLELEGDLEDIPPEPKGKRGRPSKDKSKIDTSTAIQITKPPKKRGRPRKV